jgi:hypothetical protein
MRYKDMAGSKGKSSPFKHCWALLQNLDKWKLRDQESAPKKLDMLKMDDSDEEGRNHAKPEGNKKAKGKNEDGSRGIKLEGKDGPNDQGKGDIGNEDIGGKAHYHLEEERDEACIVGILARRIQAQGRLGG